MKNLKLLLTVIFLITFVSCFQRVTAQEKTKEQQEADLKIQQKIDEQKKALVELKKAQEDAELSLDSKKSELDSTMTKMQVEMAKANLSREKIFRELPRGNGSFVFDEPFEFSGHDGQAFFIHSMGGAISTGENHSTFQKRRIKIKQAIGNFRFHRPKQQDILKFHFRLINFHS